jgi:hypothetical protein
MTRPIRASRGSAALAHRLRELRERRWPDRPVTQRQLGEALGEGKPLSVATISGYESEDNPTTPPARRLVAYATFFATERSLAEGRARVLPDSDLDGEERAARDSLLEELRSLAGSAPVRLRAVERSPGLWTFPEGEPVRIVCGHLRDMSHPYSDPGNQNYTELLTFADVDALTELYAHVWRLNPTCDIRYLRADRLAQADDINSHLVLLGGNGLNAAVQRVLELTDLPLRQVTDNGLVADGDVFALDDEMDRFLPTKTDDLGLVEDTGLFARLRNPYNSARTLTLCSGVFSRGVVGAVRLLTDAELRERNEAYLEQRFADAAQFAILMRVQVLLGSAITPDLEDPEVRLFEWSDAEHGRTTPTRDRGTGRR